MHADVELYSVASSCFLVNVTIDDTCTIFAICTYCFVADYRISPTVWHSYSAHAVDPLIGRTMHWFFSAVRTLLFVKPFSTGSFHSAHAFAHCFA